MGATHIPVQVTPLVAMLAGKAEYFQAAKAPLEALFGPVEIESELYSFAKTEYYTPTMGPGLLRRFFMFEKLADPAGFAAWELATNSLELELAKELAVPGGPPRPINLDPGYLTGAKLLLAST